MLTILLNSQSKNKSKKLVLINIHELTIPSGMVFLFKKDLYLLKTRFLQLYIMGLKKTIVFFVVLLCVFKTNAQQDKNNFWSNVRYGGGIGLNFGDNFFSGTIAPSAIYEFDNDLALGVGLNATFNNQKHAFKSTILGGSILGLYNVINELQTSAEFEYLNVNRRFESNLNIPNDNYWVPALFVGLGYRSNNVTIGVRYDVLYDKDKSIYADPWIPFIRFYF